MTIIISFSFIFVILQKLLNLFRPKKAPNEYTSKDIDDHVDGCYRVGRLTKKDKKFKIGASNKKSSRNRRDSEICNYNSHYCSSVFNNKFNFSHKLLFGISLFSLFSDDNIALDDGEVYTTFLQAITYNGSILSSPYYPPIVTVDPDCKFVYFFISFKFH